MRNVSIIRNGEEFPTETIRIEPLERGRVALFVKTSAVVRKGEHLVMRTSSGAETECVVSDITGMPHEAVVELRCIADSSL